MKEFLFGIALGAIVVNLIWSYIYSLKMEALREAERGAIRTN